MIQKVCILFLLCSAVVGQAQNTHKVPKYKSFELGYRYIPSSSFDIQKHGTTFLFDYAWQLSGFSGKPAGFISVPIGYTLLRGSEPNVPNASILSYGWTVKHHLKSGRPNIPFLGYGLLLNQLSIDGTSGKVFGHQTRFDFGYLFRADEKWSPFAKAEYSMTRYPQLGQKKADMMQALEIKLGVRF